MINSKFEASVYERDRLLNQLGILSEQYLVVYRFKNSRPNDLKIQIAKDLDDGAITHIYIPIGTRPAIIKKITTLERRFTQLEEFIYDNRFKSINITY